MNDISFLFDQAMSYIPGLSLDLKTVFSALLLFGIIIFGIFLLRKAFYGAGHNPDSSSSVNYSIFHYSVNLDLDSDLLHWGDEDDHA